MRPFFSLFRVAGINIRVHFSFIILPALLGGYYGWQYGTEVGLRAFCLVLLVFACVIGHELCHSLRALGFGIKVPVITLNPMGGVATMMRIPREPWQEFWIAIVGPFFNFALAIILFIPLYLII